MARRKAVGPADEPALFAGGATATAPQLGEALRVFVTNDELRTCLSKHMLAPWFDRAAQTIGQARVTSLVPFNGPVAIETLDGLRSRGPNTYWIGIEVDADDLPPEPVPAVLPAVLPFARVRRIVFRCAAELDQFEITRMANVELPSARATCDPTWFEGDALAMSVRSGTADLDEAAASKAAADAESFRRRFGAAIAVIDGAATGGTLHSALMDLALGPDPKLGPPDVDDTEAVLTLLRPLDSHVDAGVAAWHELSAPHTGIAPMDPQLAVDRHVRASLIDHLRAAADAMLDRQQLAGVIEAAAEAARRNERLTAAADRYPKAILNLRRLWRNEISWDSLLHVWPTGFPTLAAAMALASVSDADQYDVLHQRLVERRLPAGAAQLASFFYGLRWGIDAIPTRHRGPEPVQRLAEKLTWSTIMSGQPARASLQLARAPGRSLNRPYLLDVKVDHESYCLEIDLATVVGAKFQKAAQTAPDELRRALTVLAAAQPSASRYLSWRVRLPRSTYLTSLERGRAILSGSMNDGPPTIDYEWSDWPAFAAEATQPTGTLEQLTKAADLSTWERAIDAAASAKSPAS